MDRTSFSFGRRVSDGVAMFAVMWLSMLCLIYVAYGEATRTYERFQGDKLAGQAQIVQNAMETYLRSGLALRQFVGFGGLANQILESDSSISSLIVTDPAGTIVFVAGEDAVAETGETIAVAKVSEKVGGAAVTKVGANGDFKLERVDGRYRVVVPLNDKFESVGRLYITMPTAAVTDYVWQYFEAILLYSIAPALIFAIFMAVYGRQLQGARVPWAQITFAFIFLTSAAVVIVALISLYSVGAQAKAQALAESLGQRLSPIIQFNLNLEEIEGLDKVFKEYLVVNPDLSSAALTVDDKIVIHTDPERLGKTWVLDKDNYQYVVDLTPNDLRNVKVAVELPSDVVIGEILRSVKNFAALFIASAFLANLFFQVGGATVRRALAQNRRGETAPEEQGWLVDYVKPVFFLGVLAEHLTYAFLPQHVQAIAKASGVAEGWAMTPFMLFYACFALTLVPAGFAAQRFSPRPLMYIGLILAGIGLLGTTLAEDFWTIVLARGFAGIGQGMLFIGVQAYLLAVSSAHNKTQASAIIVYGFQGGMISGMAVGSLLVGTMGPTGVFTLGAIIAIVAAAYAIGTVPALDREAVNRIASSSSSNSLFSGVGRAMRNAEFMGAMVSIGLPAKAVLTGVVSFALPLLLSQALYPQEDIGQIIMIYALSVVVSSQFVAPYVDRIGDARTVLFQGTVLSGIGLLLVAGAGVYAAELAVQYGDAASTVALVLGIGLIGVAHGFINAPIVTYVSGTQLATSIGPAAATSTYRFLERIGHVAGPMLVGQMFLWFSNDWSAIGFIGGSIIILGVLCYMLTGTPPRQGAEDARPAGA